MLGIMDTTRFHLIGPRQDAQLRRERAAAYKAQVDAGLVHWLANRFPEALAAYTAARDLAPTAGVRRDCDRAIAALSARTGK